MFPNGLGGIGGMGEQFTAAGLAWLLFEQEGNPGMYMLHSDLSIPDEEFDKRFE